MANNLIVDDDYTAKQAAAIKTKLTQMNRILKLYIRYMETMNAQAVQDGATAAALETFIDYAKQLEGDLSEIGDVVSSLMTNYLLAIDEADQYLF